MKEDVIRQVKAAEDQAEEKIRQAHIQAEKILHDARHQAVELRADITDAARDNAKQLFEQGTTGFEPELENVRKLFQHEIAEDSAKAQITFEAVVEDVVAKFQERLRSDSSK